MKNYNSIQEKIISSWLLKDKLFWTLFPSIFLFDQITKYLVYKNLALGQSIPDDFFIKITYARNTGTAFSLFSSYGSLLLIISIFVAHIIALKIFKNQNIAIRSQYPMLFLMVFYTALSLWIIAQPIVES